VRAKGRGKEEKGQGKEEEGSKEEGRRESRGFCCSLEGEDASWVG